MRKKVSAAILAASLAASFAASTVITDTSPDSSDTVETTFSALPPDTEAPLDDGVLDEMGDSEPSIPVIKPTETDDADADGDGLSDEDELLYNTDPKNYDTDRDSLSDGDEITLGLDPLNAKSDGKNHDSTRLIKQELSSENFTSSLLSSSNPTIPSLILTAKGNVNKSIFVTPTASEDLNLCEAVISNAIDVSGDTEFMGTLSFKLDERLSALYSEDLPYRPYVICRYSEDSFTSLFATSYDESSATLSAEIIGEGSYFVLDVTAALGLMEIDTETLKITADHTNGRRIYLNGPIPVPVYLDTEPSTASNTDTDKDGISDADELLGFTSPTEFDLEGFIKAVCKDPIQDIDIKTVTAYGYESNPILQDTDFDGIADAADSAPKDNRFTGKMVSYDSDGNPKFDSDSGNIGFTVDYRQFFGDNTRYNSKISALSSVYASDAYVDSSDIESDSNTDIAVNGLLEEPHTPDALAALFGFKDVQCIPIGYTDNDRTDITVGHINVSKHSQNAEIILVAVRGTNGTFEEWSSNFDVGADTEAYYRLTGQHPEWTNKNNHKGFDITAQRVIAAINEYTQTYLTDGTDTIYWITGHSRGGAIANIIGADFENAGKRTFVYTFASPATTSGDIGSCRTIFNIINGDDMITKLPLRDMWGFRRYGTDITVNVSDFSGKKTLMGGSYTGGPFKEMTGTNYDNNEKIETLIEYFSEISDCREKLYEFTYEKGTSTTVSTEKYSLTKAQEILEEKSGTLPQALERLSEYRIETERDILGSTVYKVYCYQTPAFFMQSLAYLASGNGGYDIIVGGRIVELADAYTDARNYFVLTFLSGMTHPHLPQTYYLIAADRFTR